MKTFIILKPWNIKLAALNISTVTIKGFQEEDFLTFQTSYSSESQLLSYLDGSIKKNLNISHKSNNITGSGIFNAKDLTVNAISSSS